MSLAVSLLIDDAARKIGDPNKTRVTADDWLLFYNQSTRELCIKANVMRYRARFNLGAQALYHYPDEMTVMTGVWVNETPDDPDTWREVKEMFEDEFRAETGTMYPNTQLPERYFADRDGFYLVPRPSGTITNGGRVHYYGLPDRIFDLSTALYQLPEFTQDYTIRRLVVHGLRARNRHAEADSELREWYTDVEGLADKMEDRSEDRRSSIRPRVNRTAGMV